MKYNLPLPFVADLISIAVVPPLLVSETVSLLLVQGAAVVVPNNAMPFDWMRNLSVSLVENHISAFSAC